MVGRNFGGLAWRKASAGRGIGYGVQTPADAFYGEVKFDEVFGGRRRGLFCSNPCIRPLVRRSGSGLRKTLVSMRSANGSFG